MPDFELDRRRAVPEVLLGNGKALALWVHFKENPRANLRDAAAATKLSVRYAYELEKWLIQNGLLVEVRFGNGHEVFEQRLVINPNRDGPERRALWRQALGEGDPEAAVS